MDLSKFTSRKFIISAAAFLASLGAGLSGYFAGNDTVCTAGIICTVVSGALYAASEAYVDGKAASSNIKTTATSITASTTAKDVVVSAINGEQQK